MRRYEAFDLFFLHAPWIQVLSRHDRIDRQEWFALVFERRGDWSLKESIKCEQVLRRRRRSDPLVELKQIAIRRTRLLVSLVFVDALKNFSHFEQLCDRLPFVGA